MGKVLPRTPSITRTHFAMCVLVATRTLIVFSPGKFLSTDAGDSLGLPRSATFWSSARTAVIFVASSPMSMAKRLMALPPLLTQPCVTLAAFAGVP